MTTLQKSAQDSLRLSHRIRYYSLGLIDGACRCQEKKIGQLVNEVMAVRLSELDTDAINRLLVQLQNEEERILEALQDAKRRGFSRPSIQSNSACSWIKERV